MARELFGELLFVLLALTIFGHAYDMQKAAERRSAAPSADMALALAEPAQAR